MARSRRRFLGALFVLGTVFLLALSWLGPGPFVAPDLDSATVEQLEKAAQRWWPSDDLHWRVPEEDWPPKLRQLHPESVRVVQHGVYIVYGSFFVEQWGLFVLPVGSDFEPREHGDPSYRHLSGRVYWYRIKG